jgi:hypothetical protein
MRKWISLAGANLILASVMIVGPSGASQTNASPQPAAPASVDVDTPDDSLLRWPLPPGGEKYAAIDGKRLHKDVVAQALIARRYRDQVHPKFWGRIIGTSSDAESAEWLARRFKEINKLPLSDLQRPPPEGPYTPRIDLADCAAWIKDSSATCDAKTEQSCASTAPGCRR